MPFFTFLEGAGTLLYQIFNSIPFLRKLYPEVKENLEQFRTHLKESAHEMAPLKVWQLQGNWYRTMVRNGDTIIEGVDA